VAEKLLQRRAPRILLAEDEVLIAADIETMLEELGCEVVGPVATLAQVERLVVAEALEGAVLDVNLRGVAVFGALPVLHARQIPVILSSGYGSSALFPEEFRHLPVLVKPYDRRELAALLRTTFGLRIPF
jgi:DNA-binding NtrC family response regulator